MDIDMKVPSVENPEPTNLLSLKHKAIHAAPSAGNFFFLLCSIFPVSSPSFFPDPLLLSKQVVSFG